MNTNLKNLNAMLNSGDIDKFNWNMHFADVPETIVPTCDDCLDRKNGTCCEMGNPIECFLYGIHSKSNKILLDIHNVK